MDAVTSGLIAGATASSLLVFGGVVAYASDMWRGFMGMEMIFAWFVVLTALTVGQLGVTGIILQKLAAGPSQAKGAVVA
jgi:hypothetical protein